MPNQAWKRLQEGNRRFVNDEPEHPNQDITRREAVSADQTPFVSLFGCADSRVAAEMIFDVGLGDMFVVRNAGQVVDPVTLGSLEYGVEILGTPLLVVLGHDSCGAVTAAYNAYDTGDTPPGFISDVVARILPTVARARKNNRTTVNETVVQNTIDTVEKIMQLSTLISRAVDEGRLIIVGMTYQLHDGHTTVVAQYGGDEAAVSSYAS
ncbi:MULTISPECIES: carbonic anhydrase [Brevibacterium]|uniref:carbonic anhydrase n=3 Tax=Brevibacterium TaxID=1696 RepID=K9APR0_9MICO|nr:carbonic anhydrase [Brevibacterium casei]EKU49294.1 carbonate dehydratase [Brevibacterium casei S18]MBE4695658.1 carbonic anhydrase [Brevibacterium casei]MBY3578780.1 carbonic anhydrase [Brevibacterium casei]MCT1765719.1 carbonic anhydrase [Brevibacterium casei]MCT2359719.1 carbonic anhydrase [Brevibacterium casei]